MYRVTVQRAIHANHVFLEVAPRGAPEEALGEAYYYAEEGSWYYAYYAYDAYYYAYYTLPRNLTTA